ncbi:MAG: type IV pilus modification protein PilV [Pseudomonadota bacterium]|nr:type IV pilus modification protein PilV [Pseudomonadota bacterium]
MSTARSMPVRRALRAGQRGALIIEVLVAILICAFGLLGFAGMQARATSAEFEGFQRSQALVLVEDMVSRMNANRGQAATYVRDDVIGAGAMVDCAALTGAALDLCEWGNLIRGSSEQRGGAGVGAMLAARGCITRPNTSTDRYVISVAWQGILPTSGATSPCGLGDAAFPNDPLRRAVSSTVCVARLRDPATAPVLPRC